MSAGDIKNQIDTLVKNNNESMQKIIELRNNPNPVYIVCILIGYFIVIYFLYIFLVKDDISGKWKDSDDNNYEIMHNKFNDNIIVYKKLNNIKNKKCKKSIGVLHGNILIMQNNKYNNIGVYLNDRIKWLDNKLWYKIGC